MRSPKLIIVSSEETRAELDELLSNETKTAVIGWTSAEAHASPAELLALTSPFLEEARAREEAEVVERWREEAGRGGRAASGWSETLEAASDARIERALYEENATTRPGSARRADAVSPARRQCPLDGTETEHREDGLDLDRAPDDRERRHRLGGSPGGHLDPCATSSRRRRDRPRSSRYWNWPECDLRRLRLRRRLALLEAGSRPRAFFDTDAMASLAHDPRRAPRPRGRCPRPRRSRSPSTRRSRRTPRGRWR